MPLGYLNSSEVCAPLWLSVLTCQKKGLSVSPQMTVCFTDSHSITKSQNGALDCWWDGLSAPLSILPLRLIAVMVMRTIPAACAHQVPVLWKCCWVTEGASSLDFLRFCLLSGSDKRASGDRNTKRGRQERGRGQDAMDQMQRIKHSWPQGSPRQALLCARNSFSLGRNLRARTRAHPCP